MKLRAWMMNVNSQQLSRVQPCRFLGCKSSMLSLPHLRHAQKPPPRAFTTGTLPPFVDPKQPPTKRQPFAALTTQKWVSTLDMLLPSDIAKGILEEVGGKTVRYAKVIMNLGDLLEGPLFTEGVKSGQLRC